MLVEDDCDIRAVTMLALSLDPGLVVIEVACGQEALRRLKRAPSPDLILIDNQLPDMDGVTLARAIQRSYRPAPSIAFFTASVRPSDHDKYESVHAAGVIEKPFDPFKLVDEVREMLRRAPPHG